MTTDLIKKLEALTGPDREIDAELEAIFVGGRVHYNDTESKEAVIERPIGGFWIRHITPYRKIKRYTSSVDAAIALAERVLPTSVAKRLIVFNSSPAKAGFDGTPERGKLFYFEAHNPAIAACIAILKAKGAST